MLTAKRGYIPAHDQYEQFFVNRLIKNNSRSKSMALSVFMSGESTSTEDQQS